MDDMDRALPGEAVSALERGSKIEAIKSVRIAHGVGLKEAKEIVERYIDRTPRVKTSMAAANAETAKGALRWIAITGVLALLAYYFYRGNS